MVHHCFLLSRSTDECRRAFFAWTSRFSDDSDGDTIPLEQSVSCMVRRVLPQPRCGAVLPFAPEKCSFDPTDFAPPTDIFLCAPSRASSRPQASGLVLLLRSCFGAFSVSHEPRRFHSRLFLDEANFSVRCFYVLSNDGASRVSLRSEMIKTLASHIWWRDGAEAPRWDGADRDSGGARAGGHRELFCSDCLAVRRAQQVHASAQDTA